MAIKKDLWDQDLVRDRSLGTRTRGIHHPVEMVSRESVTPLRYRHRAHTQLHGYIPIGATRRTSQHNATT